MLAIITAIKEYHCYLGGTKFKIDSDHSALAHLRRAKLSSNGRLARWALFMEGYQYTVKYRKRALMRPADCLSRCQGDPEVEDVQQETETSEPPKPEVNAILWGNTGPKLSSSSNRKCR